MTERTRARLKIAVGFFSLLAIALWAVNLAATQGYDYWLAVCGYMPTAMILVVLGLLLISAFDFGRGPHDR